MAMSPEMKKIKPQIDELMQKNNGWKLLKDILEKNEDPAKPIGMFLSQLVMQFGQQMLESGAPEDAMGVFLEDDGVVEYILNTLEKHFDLPSEFSDEIFMDVVEALQAAVQDPNAQGQPQGAPAGQGLAAQGGM